jgi:type II secretory pathway pseudopilin PulG
MRYGGLHTELEEPLAGVSSRSRRRAFSLAELIVAFIVLGVLATVSVMAFRAVVDRTGDRKMMTRTTSFLKQAQALYVQRIVTNPTYTWNQAVADAVDDLPSYKTGALAPGVDAAPISSGQNGWTVTVDTGASVFSHGPSDIVVYTTNDTAYVASATSDDTTTRAVYGYVTRTGAPRVWIAECGGSTCDARTGSGGPPTGGGYPVGTQAPTVPGLPLSGSTALASGSFTSVEVSFLPPDDDGGEPVDSYRATCTSSDGGTTRTATGSTPITVSSLTSGKSYTCTVAAHNTVGWSQEASTTGTISTISTPSAPSITSLAPGAGSFSVAFSAPSDDGGSSITAYQYSLDGGAWVAFAGTSSPQSITGLTASQTYTVYIRAQNVAGFSLASDGVTASAATVPGAPTISGITSTDGTLTVAFTAPGSNGGSPITAYQYSLNSGAWTSFSGSTTTQTITGLSVAASYSVRVRAQNAVGDSAASAAVTKTADGPPSAPTLTSVSAASSSSITVSWSFTDPGDLAGFVVKNAGGTTVATLGAAVRSTTIGSLSQNTSYTYYVIANDAAGNDSAASSSSSATTSNAAPPAPAPYWSDGGHVNFGAYWSVTYPGQSSTAYYGTYYHRLCWAGDLTQEVYMYRLWIDGVAVEDQYRGGGWGSTVCSQWNYHGYGDTATHTYAITGYDDYWTPASSRDFYVVEGSWRDDAWDWVEDRGTSSASTTLTINGCSDAGYVYRDPFYNRVYYASWSATIARAGSPYYDLTSATRQMQRRTGPGGYTGWAPVTINTQYFNQNRSEGYSTGDGYWGSRATPGVSPCYWNTTYPTRFVTTIDYWYKNWTIRHASFDTYPSYS